MRLIDADALIQHTYSAVVDGVETDIIDVSNVDNAPTVLCDNYSMGYQDGVKNVLLERPQMVIRCKACKYYHPYEEQFTNKLRGDGYCVIARMSHEGMTTINCTDDWYCADGRKKNETN